MNEIVTKRKEYIFPASFSYYDQPLVVTKGEGMYIYDADGRQYLDFFGGILTVGVGHCHPKVTAKTQKQVETLVHTSAVYFTEPMAQLAETIADITPGDLKKTLFTNSGTEANETAILLSKIYTGCSEVIALRHSYHGRSMLAMSLTGQSNWRAGGTHQIGIKHAHSPYCYRCSFGLMYPECDLKCATDVEELIITETSGKIAGFIVEPVQGVGGFVVPPPDYFKVVADIVREHGGVFIADEVQTGWGRTGDHMFGISHYGVEPDIMTMAKGMANGLPIGATVATREVADSLPAPTLSTFGGSPVSTAAAQATVDVIREDGLVANCGDMGRRLQNGLAELATRYDFAGDVRGLGLMQGVEVVGEDKEPLPGLTDKIMNLCRDEGLLIGKGGLYGNVLRISPALNVTAGEVDDALETIGNVFAQVDAG